MTEAPTLREINSRNLAAIDPIRIAPDVRGKWVEEIDRRIEGAIDSIWRKDLRGLREVLSDFQKIDDQLFRFANKVEIGIAKIKLRLDYERPILGIDQRLLDNPSALDELSGALMCQDVPFDERLRGVENDPIKFDVACREAAAIVKSVADPPQNVRDFISEVLRGDLVRPSPRGKHPAAYLMRDMLIVQLVEGLVIQGFTATRADAKAVEDSACDVIAKTNVERRVSPRSYTQVKDIWMRRGSHGWYFER
ncbi:hypothetical protein [Antarctobacter sp.]|uniref:hypothetical protein n=1 Tax=Antarctobacter sp. TaxID=1872577 RepID=UPI002B277CE0|nr:hypothetical protein [Antarctobacter sp.]